MSTGGKFKLTSQGTIVDVSLRAGSLGALDSNPSQNFVDDFLVHHESQKQVVVLAVMICPERPKLVLFWEGVVNANVAIARENAFSHLLFLHPLGELLDVLTQVNWVNFSNIFFIACLFFVSLVAHVVTLVVSLVIALLVEAS